MTDPEAMEKAIDAYFAQYDGNRRNSIFLE